jgi:hypothetical protein
MALTRVSRHIIDEPLELQNINATGIGTFASLRVTGDLQVDGTTTTLDTVVTEVDKLEVSANNSTVGVAITQSGSGDILRLYDGASQKVTVTDNGKIGIGINSPSQLLHVNNSNANAIIQITSSDTNKARVRFGDQTSDTRGEVQYDNANDSLAFKTGGNIEKLRITSDGKVGIGLTNPSAKLHLKDSGTLGVVAERTGSAAVAVNADSVGTVIYSQQSYGSSTGVPFRIITGLTERLRITSDGKVRVPDNGKFVAGAGDDLQIYHDGSNSYISDVGDGGLFIQGSGGGAGITIEDPDGNDFIKCIDEGTGGTVELYKAGSKKLETTTTGIQVTGQVNASTMHLTDGNGIHIGNSNDLRVYHDGNNSAINDVGTGNFYIQGSDSIYFRDYDTSENHVVMNKNGSVDLYHNGTKKLETTSDGATITGELGFASGGTYQLKLSDNQKIRFGGGNDLQIFHDGSNNYIQGSTGNIVLKNSTGDYFVGNVSNGAAEVYYNNSKKLETTTTGAKVTGALEVTQEYPSIRPTLDLNFAATKTLDRRITFTRDSVGTYTDENGLVKYASNNVPRFDHDSTTGESLGLLIEESRTNIAPYGNDMSQYSSSNMTKTANDAVAPDGTTTATKLQHGGGGNNWYLDYSPGSPNASGAGTYTYSVWVKAPDDQPDDYYGCRIAILTTTGNNTEAVFSLAKTWRRISITKTYGSETGTIRIHPLIFRNTPGNTDGGKVTPSYVWVWGSQWEQGSFATSYIPTSGSTVTRAADLAKITGTNFTDFYNQTEGTFFIDSAVARGSAYQGYVGSTTNSAADGGPSYNFNSLMSDADNSDILLNIWDGTSGAQALISIAHPTGNMKAAGAFKDNDFAISMNGSAVSTDTSGTIDTNQDQLWIGRRPYSNAGWLNNSIKRVSYYNKRLPNAQLQGLTQQ